MDKAGFHQDLRDLLDDPITHHVMASDRVDMASLLDLLHAARRRLDDAQTKRPARGRPARSSDEVAA